MQNSPHSQAAAEVWRRFAGMYGADAVERKYGREIPVEWVSMISRLNEHQVQRGVRQLAYSGKPHVPSLPEFVKLCRDAEHDQVAPTVHPALTRDPDPNDDAWGGLANRRLIQYLSTMIPQNSKRYGRPPSVAGMRDSKDPNADASPEFVRAMKIFAAFKNQWADLMRDSATADGVPIPEQEASWKEGMRMAEAQIALELAA